MCRGDFPTAVLGTKLNRGVSSRSGCSSGVNARPGDTVGPYTVEAACGQGGMARVYRAVGPDGEVVALKLVRPELAVEDMFRRRFAREVETAARIDHPHVVPVLDSGEHEGVPYMAQPFIRGGSLQEKLEREGRLDLETAVTLCLQVAKGVGALHAHGLIHRDLKPANILLDERRAARSSRTSASPRTCRPACSPSPGRPSGRSTTWRPSRSAARRSTSAADVYSLGCVMFECLAGEPPFADRQGMQVLWAHLRDEPPNPCAERPDVSAGRLAGRSRARSRRTRRAVPPARPPTRAWCRWPPACRRSAPAATDERARLHRGGPDGRASSGRRTPGTTIGRAECDVELNDPDVSRRHAVVRQVDAGLAIEDLGSTNGTFVNDQRVEGIVELSAGRPVRFGNTVWRLESQGAAGPKPRRTTRPRAEPPPAEGE